MLWPAGLPDNYGVKRREQLSLECPHCGATFPSAMQMDSGTFEKIRIKGMLERCEVCKQASRFKKKDYFFR